MKAVMKNMMIEPSGQWEITLSGELPDGTPFRERLPVPPPELVPVHRERHTAVPLYSERKWLAGTRLNALIADECTVSGSLVPDSVRAEKEDGTELVNGTDYLVDPVWGAFGRLAESDFGENDTVYLSYSYFPQRIDSIVRNGAFYRKTGTENGPTPLPPELEADETLICNIFFDRSRKYLTGEMIYRFQESYTLPESGRTEQQLAKTLAKLRAGKPVKILAWGDSVTVCRFIKDESRRWVNRFTDELRRRFPNADIETVNLGWGGKAVNTFQCEPPGSPYNYQERVADSGADLVLLEFVNDCYLTMKPEFDRIYNRIRDDFRARGMELIVILPHPTRPDWMELLSQNHIKEDPRPYVKFLRQFAAENDYACADVSARFLHLWKEGIPYNTLMLNNINHPDQRGVDLYAEVVLSLFPKQ